MVWLVSELDKNKTEQSIANEEARLDICREILDNLKKEYEQRRCEYMTKLSVFEDKIATLEASIDSGEKFIEDCNEHLNKDFNENIE